MARKYPFPVPYKITAGQGALISMAINTKPVHDALPRLRQDVVAKLQACSFFNHPTFTKDELDSIPADLWRQLEPHLG